MSASVLEALALTSLVPWTETACVWTVEGKPARTRNRDPREWDPPCSSTARIQERGVKRAVAVRADSSLLDSAARDFTSTFYAELLG